MIVQGLTPADRATMSAALRAGDPIRLELSGPVPRAVRLDEIAPLCYSAFARNEQDQRVLDAFRPPPAQPGSKARVTAIVPCHRGAPVGVAALFKQDIPVRVLVLSNGEDGPRRVPGAELLRVPWEGHGRTRRKAVALVDDPYVLFTVDDALPLGGGCLRTLVEALEAGPWDAVVARQVPWPDADRVTAERIRRWTPAGHHVVPFSQTDHVATLYRTETLRRFPLPELPIAEDMAWSQGRRVGYVPTAPFVHAHVREASALYQRNRDIHEERVALGLPRTVPGLGALVAALPGTVRPALIGGAGEWRCQMAELLGQWVGGKRGVRRRR